jgi:hypothetical protein
MRHCEVRDVPSVAYHDQGDDGIVENRISHQRHIEFVHQARPIHPAVAHHDNKANEKHLNIADIKILRISDFDTPTC